MQVQQSDIDELATEVNLLDNRLKEGLKMVQIEVDNLEAQINAGTPTADLDLTPLREGLASIGADVEKVGQIVPTPAQPAPGGTGQAPTQADGTAAPNTVDPKQAAEQAQQSA